MSGEVQSFQQMSHIDAWNEHSALVMERVRKTLARERMLKRDFREYTHYTETTEYYRWGVGGRLVQCALAEASQVLFTRKEWFA